MPLRLTALFFCWFAHSAIAAEAIVGAYEVKGGKPPNSGVMRLECASETSCTFTYISQMDSEPPRQEKHVLKEVRPVENLTEAVGALKYAIDHQSQTIAHEEYAEMMGRLRPVLAGNPGVAKCWDLNFTAPTYMLACTLSNTPKGSPPIYLFGTLMANCGEGFCRFVIYPMLRAKK